jgi:hypothetical protein
MAISERMPWSKGKIGLRLWGDLAEHLNQKIKKAGPLTPNTEGLLIYTSRNLLVESCTDADSAIQRMIDSTRD